MAMDRVSSESAGETRSKSCFRNKDGRKSEGMRHSRR